MPWHPQGRQACFWESHPDFYLHKNIFHTLSLPKVFYIPFFPYKIILHKLDDEKNRRRLQIRKEFDLIEQAKLKLKRKQCS